MISDREVHSFCDNLDNPKPKKKVRGVWLACGSFLVGFSLLSIILLVPLWDGRNGLDVLGDLVGGVEKQIDTIGDESEDEPEAYHYWYAPSNSFGIQSTKTVNWSYFRQLFKNSFQYKLEYRTGSTWVEGNEFLTIGFDWQGEGFWKINLTFAKPPSPEMDVRFTIGMNKQVLNYVEKVGQYEYWLNYTANNTEVYNCFFNWSDLMNIPDLVFNHGVQDNLFWFRLRKDGIPTNSLEKVYIFDPTFGETQLFGSTLVVSNKIFGMYATNCSSSGVADNITVYLDFAAGGYNEEVTCILYNEDLSLVDQTEIIEFDDDDDGWYVFDFAGSPNVVGGNRYFVSIWAENDADIGDSVGVRYINSGHNGLIQDNEVWDGTAPNTLSNDTWYAGWGFSIYCSYTESAPENSVPTSSNEAPTNSSTGVTYVAGGITTYLVVTDTDGDTINATWWSNSSEAWKQYGVANTTEASGTNISQLNANFTTGGTKYWWWVKYNDGMGAEVNDSFSFTIASNVSEAWHLTEVWNFSFSNTTQHTLVNSWDFSFSNSTQHNLIELWNFSFSNTSTHILIESWNFSFSNTSEQWKLVESWVFSFSNTSNHVLTELWNFSFSNTSEDWYLTESWNFSFSNTSTHILTELWNFSFSNTTRDIWTLVESWVFSFSNTSNHVLTELWNFSFSNTSEDWYLTESWNFSFSNTSSHVLTEVWNFSFSNTTRDMWTLVESWNFSFSNTSNHVLTELWNFSFSNTTGDIWNLVEVWNFSFSNTSEVWNLVEVWNFSFGNSSIIAITISNIYPSNLSINIGIQPYLYATFNSTTGNTLNISWYYNGTLLATEINSTNGTYNELLFEATERSTNYTWEVKINDGHGNWLNNSYSFTTESLGGSGFNRRILDPFALMGIMIGVLCIFLIFLFSSKKKRGENEWEYQ